MRKRVATSMPASLLTEELMVFRLALDEAEYVHSVNNNDGSGRAAMSNLVVFDFDGIHTADEVLNKLRSLQKEYLIDLEDACVVEREKGGKTHIKQAVNLTAMGAAAGGIRGALWGDW